MLQTSKKLNETFSGRLARALNQGDISVERSGFTVKRALGSTVPHKRETGTSALGCAHTRPLPLPPPSPPTFLPTSLPPPSPLLSPNLFLLFQVLALLRCERLSCTPNAASASPLACFIFNCRE